MPKTVKEGRCYLIINTDEPYAEEVYSIMKRGQQGKNQWPEGNISFDEWHRTTFGCAPQKADSPEYVI
jgi:hypothetical protein